MKKIVFEFAVIIGLLATPAFAADMAVKAPPPPPVPPGYDWSGFYLGLEGAVHSVRLRTPTNYSQTQIRLEAPISEAD
jgi:hypothetical protein